MEAVLIAGSFRRVLLCPTACADGLSREGLSLVQFRPCLYFRFFVVSGLLVRCDSAAAVAAAGKAASPGLYGPACRPEAAPVIWCSGLIGGYPVGHDRIAMLSEGVLSREAWAERVNRFCNCAQSGPASDWFGLGVFCPAQAGAMLYGIHIVSALIVGLFSPARTPLSADVAGIHNRNRTSFPSIFCGVPYSRQRPRRWTRDGISDHVFHPAAAAFRRFCNFYSTETYWTA